MKPRREKAGTELEVTISELAPGGDGVGLLEIGGERRAVFLAGVAVGDRVAATVDLSKRPARGRVTSLLAAGPDRVEPACAWAGTCGGCDWMHVSHDAQLRAHEAHVRGALPEAWRGVAITTHAASRELGYRTRARLHVRGSGGRAVIGMNEAGSRDPIEVDRCAVLHPELEAARAKLAGIFEGAAGKGEAQLALGAPEGDSAARGAVLELQWSGLLAGHCFGRLEAAVKDGWLAGARVTAGETRVPAKVGDPTPWILGGDGAPLKLAPGGFGQASDEGNVRLAQRVAELTRLACVGKSDAKVLELYAGAGNFTVLLAPLGKVVAVEASREACDAARVNLTARGAGDRAKVVEADAGQYAIAPQTHVVVLDPPRTGARDACARIATSKAAHVVYVSCDPQTLARDLALLPPAYTLRSVDLFELFPQTSHVETVVHLERARS